MTFSLLAHDAASGKWGGIAATGNLCVGGWVLRGRIGAGISASQGQSPSTMWGEDVLDLTGRGMQAQAAVDNVVLADSGRAFRQLAVLDPGGNAGAFTGGGNGDNKGHILGKAMVACGNILADRGVLVTMAEAFVAHEGAFEDRLVASLVAGESAGGDERGARSAAMLVLSREAPPLSLRIDMHDDPVRALQQLLGETRSPGYRAWLDTVPSPANPENCGGGAAPGLLGR